MKITIEIPDDLWNYVTEANLYKTTPEDLEKIASEGACKELKLLSPGELPLKDVPTYLSGFYKMMHESGLAEEFASYLPALRVMGEKEGYELNGSPSEGYYFVKKQIKIK